MLLPKTHFKLSYSNNSKKSKWELGTKLSLKLKIAKHLYLIYYCCSSLTFSFFHVSTMKLFIGILFCALIMGVTGEGWYSFFKEAVQGKNPGGWRAHPADPRIHSEQRPHTTDVDAPLRNHTWVRAGGFLQLVWLSTHQGLLQTPGQRCFEPSLSLLVAGREWDFHGSQDFEGVSSLFLLFSC